MPTDAELLDPPQAPSPTRAVAEGLKISGVLDLNDPESSATANGSANGECEGTGGYSDISNSAQVTVTNQSGTIVAVGQLQGGVEDGESCDFSFTVPVPSETFYSIEVSHRGQQTSRGRS